MRNILFASTAAAVLAIAGAASAQDINVGSNGYRQINNGAQLSLVVVPSVGVGNRLNVDNIAAGNTATFDADGDITVGELHQLNNGVQLAGSLVMNTGAGRIDSSTRAIGNAASFVAADDLVDFTNTNPGGDYQVNNGLGQYAGTLVLNSGIGGRAEISTAAVGNSLSIEAGSFDNYADASQINNAGQLAITGVYGVGVGGASDISAQSVGNNWSVTTTGSTNLQVKGQTNNAGQLGLAFVSNSGFGGNSMISSAAIGNNLAANIGGTAYQVTPFQTNNASQVSITYVGNSGFGSNLTAAAGAVGNSISVTTR